MKNYSHFLGLKDLSNHGELTFLENNEFIGLRFNNNLFLGLGY